MTDELTSKPVFPVGPLPDDANVARLAGLYGQRQEGLWMQRMRVPGGVLTGRQWRELAAIARRLTPDTPLHLTTRQDIELHDLTAETVPEAQQMLADAGLTGLGACGDTLRNVTVCPCSGVFTGSADLHGLGQELCRLIQDVEGVFALPRKFKISLSCCAACGGPWVNDLGFVVRRKAGEYGFRVIGAGSLGAKPATGIVLFDWLEPAHAAPLALAALRVFAAHGDREHRTRARFRHVRQRVGDEKFLAMLGEEFDKTKAERDWPAVELAKPADGFNARAALAFADGNISHSAADALAALAEDGDIRVRISNYHRVIIFGRDDAQLAQAIAAHEVLAEPARPQAKIVACPGTKWCARAIVDTVALAGRIRTELGDKLSPETAVCISGCPNGCAHSAVADFGLSGALKTVDGNKVEVYSLSAGGGMGRSEKLAEPVAAKLTPDEVLAEIGRLAQAKG